MEYRLIMEERYLCLPVKTADTEHQKLCKLELFSADEKLLEFRIPNSGEEGSYSWDYMAYVPVESWKGREILLRGDFPESFYKEIRQRREWVENKEARPALHFTADTGWINDPNGLVFHDGLYHLYFQYNPFNTEWENMSWGSAVSEDLISWHQQDTVLWPDETGTMFSGSAIVNSRGLLGLSKEDIIYFYTSAGGAGDWSEGRDFTQKLAYSKDGGKTLIKIEKPALEAVYHDSRDPKVFWHQASGAYIMVLWLRDNEFGIYRSEDLKNWSQSQLLCLPDAWECPDLFELKADDGTSRWVFWCADGYYFVGEFDGCRFTSLGGAGKLRRREAYFTKLPYAAQTYSETPGRTIMVPWLRTSDPGKRYRGAMGLPRELSLMRRGEEYDISFPPVAEYLDKPRIRLEEGALPDGPYELLIRQTRDRADKEMSVSFSGQKLTILPEQGILCFGGLTFQGKRAAGDIRVIVDHSIVEITADNDIMYLVFEIPVCDQGWKAAEGSCIEGFRIVPD